MNIWGNIPRLRSQNTEKDRTNGVVSFTPRKEKKAGRGFLLLSLV